MMLAVVVAVGQSVQLGCDGERRWWVRGLGLLGQGLARGFGFQGLHDSRARGRLWYGVGFGGAPGTGSGFELDCFAGVIDVVVDGVAFEGDAVALVIVVIFAFLATWGLDAVVALMVVVEVLALTFERVEGDAKTGTRGGLCVLWKSGLLCCIALVLTFARSGRSSVGSAAKGVVERGGGRSTVGNVGYIS